MRILLLSYGIIDYDGRLIQLYKVTETLGEVTLVCCADTQDAKKNESFIKLGNKNYLSVYMYFLFCIRSIFKAIKLREIDILLVDNYFSALVALIICRFSKVKFIVQDVRELYFLEDMKSYKGRILQRFEVKLMKKADIVLCANTQRAEIMKEHYNLKKKPMVFENIRFLEGEYDKNNSLNNYELMFKYKYNIVCTGGVSILRGTDKLIRAMGELSDEYGLYLVGGGSQSDIDICKKITSELSLKNVHLINKVPLAELRFIVQQCDIGIVNYHKNDLNNEFCASGKVYEYLAEGLPIVTTENITLSEFCEKSKTGIADDNFLKGILKVSENLIEFKRAVNDFITNISMEEYNHCTAIKIKKYLLFKENYEEQI